MDTAEDGKYDGLFLTVAQSAEGIDPLLDHFFGFLRRKTDFFTARDAGGSVGGAAKAAVLKSLEKHQKVATALAIEQQRRREQNDAEEEKRKQEKSFHAAQDEMAQRPKVEDITEEEVESIPIRDDVEMKPVSADEGQEGEKDDGRPNPALHGNGGITDRYSWTQTLSSLEIFIPLPRTVKAKDCIVEIKKTTLKVGLRGETPLIEGSFHLPVKTADCLWTLVDNKVLQLTVEKVDGMRWWNCVVDGDPEIDTQKIVPENSKLSDLDSETRATVEKMMFDQQQKQRGLPTSDQAKQAELLEKFKAAHPEMDFSKCNVNWGGSGSGMSF